MLYKYFFKQNLDKGLLYFTKIEEYYSLESNKCQNIENRYPNIYILVTANTFLMLKIDLLTWFLRSGQEFDKNFTYVLDAVGLLGILKAKQKLGVTFNFDKQDIIDFMKISKMTMCRTFIKVVLDPLFFGQKN